jgi:hypothetical protein
MQFLVDLKFDYEKVNSFFENENLTLLKPNLIRYSGNIFITFLRKKCYNIVDAHINYVEEAVDIISSYGVGKRKCL